MAATVPSHPPTPLLLLALLLLGLLSGGPGRPVVAVSAAGDPETAQESREAVEHVAFVDVGLPSPPEDRHEKCPEWAGGGECLANRPYMLENCAVSCKAAGVRNEGRAYVLPGEDAAAAAFRFGEVHGGHYKRGTLPAPQAVEVATLLQARLDGDVPDYTPDVSVTHCGKRKCTAGKLWKRAEDYRKDELYDEAGADLIRALMKSGVEADFREKCENLLQWAFQSVKRQREREAREREEEAKLEKRREEERAAVEEAEARRAEYEAHFAKFAGGLLSSSGGGGAASVGADGTATAAGRNPILDGVFRSFAGGDAPDCDAALGALRRVPPADKTADAWLVEARCHELAGSHKSALSAAGKLIAGAADHDPWLDGSPRMMAATLGANAAMQLGLSDNAISFYQTVLKFDPEQARARAQYRGLKKVVKLLNKAEEQIQKGYNNKASEFVDDCLSAIRGLDVDSPLFRSKIQLKQCTIQSAMGKHEEALSNCDAAVELRLANSDVVSSDSIKEAHLVRAEALLLDMDYDDAVGDFRAAFNLVPDREDDPQGEHREEKQELHHKLQQAMHSQRMWNGGEKDNRFNEHTGYPDGRPPERDHAKILQLPIDLEQRSKEVRCAWLKKQFKKLVRQYHPDKYKGNKKRASRKFKEVKEAKEIISEGWGC